MRLGWGFASLVDRGTQEYAVMAIGQGVTANQVLLPLLNVPQGLAIEVC